MLECQSHHHCQTNLFHFLTPTAYCTLLGEGSIFETLPQSRFFPVGAETDGSIWVVQTENDGLPTYLLELSSWDGGDPKEGNGLHYACDRLEYLFATMAISEASFNEDPTPSRTALWKRR